MAGSSPAMTKRNHRIDFWGEANHTMLCPARFAKKILFSSRANQLLNLRHPVRFGSNGDIPGVFNARLLRPQEQKSLGF
jgi:hypothetical protein